MEDKEQKKRRPEDCRHWELMQYAMEHGAEIWNKWVEGEMSENEIAELETKIGTLPSTEEDINFRYVEFTTRLDLSRFKFTQLIDFSSATFTEWANFSKATFEHSRFVTATFENTARFEETIFTLRADFGSANFTSESEFSKAIFNEVVSSAKANFASLATFTKASFTEMAFFSEATFKSAVFSGATFDIALFSGATFYADADFSKVTFNDSARFNKTSFLKLASFANVTFASVANFISSKFLSTTYFLGCSFYSTPLFFSAELYPDTSFHNAIFLQKDENCDRAARAYRTLKLFMNTNLHQKEHEFFTYEMNATTKLLIQSNKFTGHFKALPIKIYKAISDYGYSYGTPFRWLCYFIIFFTWIYYHLLYNLEQAFNLALANTIPFSLVGGKVIKEMPEPDWILLSVSSLQSIISILFIFLIGLGLRNRFRIK